MTAFQRANQRSRRLGSTCEHLGSILEPLNSFTCSDLIRYFFSSCAPKNFRATSSPGGSLWLQNSFFIRKFFSLLRCVDFRLTPGCTLSSRLRARAESASRKAFRTVQSQDTFLHYSCCSYTFAT